MADQKFRGVAVCVDVIGGDDRRPSDPIMVFGVQEMILTRTSVDSCCCSAQDETLWLRPDLHRQAGSAARLIEKGVVCWLHWNRGLLREKPIRMFREGREVLAG